MKTKENIDDLQKREEGVTIKTRGTQIDKFKMFST